MANSDDVSTSSSADSSSSSESDSSHESSERGVYTFEFNGPEPEVSREDFIFDMDIAMAEYDYHEERKALQQRLNGKHLEDDAAPSERLEIRTKDLPASFKKQNNIEFLQPCVARNVIPGRRHYIGPLRPIQQYMIPLVLYEFSFLAMGPGGTGKTTGYLLPLVNKLVEFKEIGLRRRRGPLAVIITHTESKLKHISDLFISFCTGTTLIRLFLTEVELDIMGSLSNVVIDLFCASATVMANALKKFQLPLEHLKFVVIDEFQFCTKGSDYMNDLSVLKDLIAKNGASPAYIFISALVTPERMIDKDFMKEMACGKVAKIVAPPGLDDMKVMVLPCKSTWCHFEWTLRFLAGEGVAIRKTVVLANSTWVVHTVALRLAEAGVPTIYLTKEDSLLEAEEANKMWRTEESRVIVADYESLNELDYGFVETCVLFELPNDDFSLYTKRLLELSSKLYYRRRIIIMVNTELDLPNAGAVLKLMRDLNQPYPTFIQSMEEHYNMKSQESSQTVEQS